MSVRVRLSGRGKRAYLLYASSRIRPLRVLFVTPRYAPYVGGVEQHVAEVGRRLAASGCSVCVLTTDPGGKLPSEENVDGVTIRRVRAWPRSRDYCFAPGIFRSVAAGGEDWDIVHVQSYHTLVAPLAMLGARRASAPVPPHLPRRRALSRDRDG